MTEKELPKGTEEQKDAATDIIGERSYVVVEVTFAGSTKKYEYYVVGDEDKIKDDTHAVVASPQGGPVVVKIVGRKTKFEKEFIGELKPVILTFNTEAHEAEMKRMLRRHHIMRNLAEMAERKSRLDTFRTVLAGDAEAQRLLKELDDLG